MAIADVAEYAHLNAAGLEALAAELDAIRRDIEESLGASDRAYIQGVITFQRCLDLAARIVIGTGRTRTGWVVGTLALAAAKSIENMELGHNIGHGQWDWMNDPEIHSTTWEWDMAGLSAHWKYSHNYRHHVFTNVVGVDDDLGYGVMRVTRDQQWKPSNLLQPLRHLLLALGFEYGVALHGLHSEHQRGDSGAENSRHTGAMLRKIARQAGKDYLLFPALGGRRWRRVLIGNAIANLLRNLWAYAVICCGHFVDGAEKFSPETLDGETRPQWYLRQMLGSANFRAGPVMALMSGNLCYQIEHHLFPDLPSNRYVQIAERVRVVCAQYNLPYTTGPLARQYLLTLGTIIRLAVPDRFLRATADDAPETASERTFDGGNPAARRPVPATAIRNRNNNRRHTSAHRQVVASPR